VWDYVTLGRSWAIIQGLTNLGQGLSTLRRQGYTIPFAEFQSVLIDFINLRFIILRILSDRVLEIGYFGESRWDGADVAFMGLDLILFQQTFIYSLHFFSHEYFFNFQSKREICDLLRSNIKILKYLLCFSIWAWFL